MKVPVQGIVYSMLIFTANTIFSVVAKSANAYKKL